MNGEPIQAPVVPPVESRADLNAVQKLAAILLALGEEASSMILARLDDYELERVSAEMIGLPLLSEEQQQELLREFASLALNARSAVVGSVHATQASLERAIGRFRAAELLGRLGASHGRVMVSSLQRLAEVDAVPLAGLLSDENPQTAALVLCHLPARKAAEAFAHFPPGIRDEVLERVANVGPMPLEVLETIGDVLSRKASRLVRRPGPPAGGVRSAVSILSTVDKSVREEALGQLEIRDPDLVRSIRKGLFTFEDLARLDARSLQRILREADTVKLAVALSPLDQQARQRVLGAMSRRAADTVQEEISYLGNVGRLEVTRAQDAIMEIARRLELEGEVLLERPD